MLIRFVDLPRGGVLAVPGDSDPGAVDSLLFRLRHGGGTTNTERCCAATIISHYTALLNAPAARQVEILRAVRADRKARPVHGGSGGGMLTDERIEALAKELAELRRMVLELRSGLPISRRDLSPPKNR